MFCGSLLTGKLRRLASSEEKVENVIVVPMVEGVGHIAVFKSYEEVQTWLKGSADKIEDKTKRDNCVKMPIFILRARYAPTKRGALSKEWLAQNVKEERKAGLEEVVSSRI